MSDNQDDFPPYAGIYSGDWIADRTRGEVRELRAELARLRAALEKGRDLVEDMDLRMPEQATEDADGWINSYRIPVGPWHRLLGWARGRYD